MEVEVDPGATALTKRCHVHAAARWVTAIRFYGWLPAFEYQRPLKWPYIVEPTKAVKTAYGKTCSTKPAVKRLAYYPSG